VRPPSNTQPLSAQEIITRLAELLRIDVSTIRVTGPTDAGNGRVRYTFELCSNSNGDMDPVRASNDFYALVAAGNDGGIGIENDSSDANSIHGVAAVVVAAAAFLL
jgi:hypothetical protein